MRRGRRVAKERREIHLDPSLINPIEAATAHGGDRELKLLPAGRRLPVDEAGFRLLLDRLERANRDNPEFAVQRDRLITAISEAIAGLREHFGQDLERVLATGLWAQEGVDLRRLDEAEDVVLEIVTNRDQPDFALGRRISTQVMASVQDANIDAFWLQFSTLPRPLWDRAVSFRRRTGQGLDGLGITLLAPE